MYIIIICMLTVDIGFGLLPIKKYIIQLSQETFIFFLLSCKSSMKSSLSLNFSSSLSSIITVPSMFFVLLAPWMINSDWVWATSDILLIRCAFFIIVFEYCATPVNIVASSFLRFDDCDTASKGACEMGITLKPMSCRIENTFEC